MISFLEEIVDRFIKKHLEDMENVAIVLPSKRAVVFFKYYLSKKINKPVFMPNFFAIEDFIENLSGLKILDNISLQFKLYQTYLRYPSKKNETFADFLKWSNILIHDFNEIDRNLVDAESIYQNLTNVKELESWGINDWSFADGNLTKMQIDYLSFYEGILEWYNDFNNSLIEKNHAYQGMAYRMAARKIVNLEIDWKKVWFVGLNALTKSEQFIIDVLKDKNIARVFWDADNFYLNKNHEAGLFLRQQRKKWSDVDFHSIGDHLKEKKDVFNIIGCPRSISQAKVASEIIKTIPKADLENSKTAIVLCDEKLLYPVLHNLPSEVKQLNVTMGSPFMNAPLYSFIELIFNMQINALKFDRGNFYYKDVISLIDHSYFVKIANEKELETFRSIIVRQNLVFVNNDISKQIFSESFITNLLSIWSCTDDAIDILNQLIEILKNNIVRDAATIESEVLSVFFKLMITLQKMLNDYDFVIDIKTLQLIIRQIVAQEIIPFKGEPVKGVQLMGILETRTLDFNNLIILSVNEGKLPKGKSVNSFIPYDIKKYFGLPTYTESDAVFSYHFYRLLQRSKTVTLVYNSDNDDFGGGERSRFITQLLAEYQGKINEYIYKGTNLVQQKAKSFDILNKGLEDKIIAWAKKGVSPSALNMYNNCSLHFYYHYLIGITNNTNVDEFADARILGNLIHNVLELNYPLGIINRNYILKREKKILNDLKIEFIKKFTDEGIRKGRNLLVLKIAQKLLKNFLDLEKKLILKSKKENKNINIIAKEIELFSDLKVNGVKFRLRGKIDRVDLEGNTLRIIDYKTGKVDKSELVFSNFSDLIDDPNKSKAFQLLMYVYLYVKNYPSSTQNDIITGNFSFRNLKSGLLCLAFKNEDKLVERLKITNNVIEEFESQLIIVLTRITKNSFTASPHIKFCEWCDE